MGHNRIVLPVFRHRFFGCYLVFRKTDCVARVAHLALEAYNPYYYYSFNVIWKIWKLHFELPHGSSFQWVVIKDISVTSNWNRFRLVFMERKNSQYTFNLYKDCLCRVAIVYKGFCSYSRRSHIESYKVSLNKRVLFTFYRLLFWNSSAVVLLQFFFLCWNYAMP